MEEESSDFMAAKEEEDSDDSDTDEADGKEQYDPDDVVEISV